MVNLYVASLNGSRISGCIEGDDGIFSVDVMPTSVQFADCGFKMSVDEISHSGVSGFCSSFWAPEGGLVVDPIRHLLRVGWSFHCTLNASDTVRRELFRAKCRSLLDLAPGCPLLWVIAAWHPVDGVMRCEPDSWKYGSRAGLKIQDSLHRLQEPSNAQRVVVSSVFGISEIDQLRCEREIALGNLDCLLPYCDFDKCEAAYYQGLENDEY